MKCILMMIIQNKIEFFYTFLQKRELEEIVECICNGRKGNEPYPAAVRAFCLSLYYYSPRCYEYFREKFNNTLPHPSTLLDWLSNSNIDVSSGICKHSLDVIQERAKQMMQNGKSLICNLVFDEVSIRKHIQYSQKTRNFVGYTTYSSCAEKLNSPNHSNANQSSDESGDEEGYVNYDEEPTEDRTVANQLLYS